ncbi:G-PROTEIN-RECEP-F1-2 domain-containing protein [Aphelenchoides besseyi]|nr:G-PROTEIN-RECEP-F1-2 domain-containing protein [Aphelenchoides besseyi]
MRSAEEREFLYSIVMWIMGAIALSLNCLAVYLIVRKSTIDLSGYKLYLLNFTITDMFLGCVLSFCFQPIAIVPGGGVQVVGLLKGFGGIGGHIQYTVVAFIFGHSVVGLNYCFIYRYASLCDVGARRLLRQRWFRFALIGSGELICFSLAILIFDMRVPDQTFFGYDLSISPNASIVVSSILLLTPASCAVNFICAALIVQRLHKYKEQLTRRTYHLHLKLLIALILQTTIPLFLFVLPITCIYVTTLYDLSGPLTNTLTRYIPMIALALHPIINPCITISFIEPYRRAVLPQCFSEQRIHPETTTTSYC